MMSTAAAILLPVFVQVGMTFALMLLTGRLRILAVQSGAVKIRDIALNPQAWPDAPKQAANSYNNQFELPVLFYAVVAFALITGQAGGVMVWLAWGFVIARIGHAAVHITTNHVRQRLTVFAIGAALLIAMWVVLAVRIFMAGA